MPYRQIYRCIACSSFQPFDSSGVSDFTKNNPCQTVPVSHFGNISKASIWLILTNPKGHRSDPNVGHLVSQYTRNGRSALSNGDVTSIFKHFSNYFSNPQTIHPFFGNWMSLLNSLVVSGATCTFQNGGICAVDLIKCPTVTDWQRYVRTQEGKQVTWNCHRIPGNSGARTGSQNEFLFKQICHHSPKVLIIAQGLSGYILKRYKGHKVPNGNGTIRGVWRLNNPDRISIGLPGNRAMSQIFANPGNSANLHNAIQQQISGVFP